MLRRPPRSTLTDTLFPYTTLFRAMLRRHAWPVRGPASCRLQILPVVRAAADESTRVDDQDQGHETQENQPVARDAKRPARDGQCVVELQGTGDRHAAV